MSNQFIGGDAEGFGSEEEVIVTAPAKPKGKVVPSVARQVQPATDTTVEYKPDKARKTTLEAWQTAPCADPDAIVVGLDAFGRKVELHDAKWEADNKVGARRFALGETVTLKEGLMGGTLTMGQLHTGEPTYIQKQNNAEGLALFAKEIDANGVVVNGNTKPSILPGTIKAVIYQTNLTIGMNVYYGVQVTEPPYLMGLILLSRLDSLRGEDGKDGYGN